MSPRMLLVVVVCIGIANTGPTSAIETQFDNASAPTLCAEVDNVTFYMTSPVLGFQVTATHPVYGPSTCNCPPNFMDCPPPSGDDFQFPPALPVRLYDNGDWVVWAYRLESWWRPQGMTAIGPDGSMTDAHYIAVSKKIAGAPSWPEFCVIYQDGNMRLIPHPPISLQCVCFGTSVIVGPVTIGDRPYSEISSVIFNASDKSLTLNYVAGGSANISLSVDRTQATADVSVSYSTSVPFGSLRSMYVTETNSDTAFAQILFHGQTVENGPALDVDDTIGDEIFLYRLTSSAHNQSAPDIRIRTCPPDAPDSVTAGDTAICSNGSTSLDAVVPPSATVDWFAGDCLTGEYVGTGNPLSVSPVATTTYSARVVDSNTGCMSTDCESIVVLVFDSGGGDGNGDGVVDGLDISGMVNAILGDGGASAMICAYDMDTNGLVDSVDQMLFVDALLGA
ncbi:MAG: hypothetical protein H6818_18950 [Phycisphaerales bacterium]|nr:hypothetical protein [Phycisphaerales bacterium]MCB9863827.1 hypothetical protein [Phycisphaerales bacterium]